VFRVLSPDGKVYALKQVKLDADPGLEQAVINEIELMQSLSDMSSDYIIELVGRDHECTQYLGELYS